MARVALVYPEKERRIPQYIYPGHLGISHVSSSLKDKQHEVITADANFQQILDRVDSFSPDYIGINISKKDYTRISQFVKIMRALQPQARIVLGGTQIALDPKGAMERTGADLAVIGDGTYPLNNIISGNLDTPGVVYRGRTGIVTNGFADYSMDNWKVDPKTLPVTEAGRYTFVRNDIVDVDLPAQDLTKAPAIYREIQKPASKAQSMPDDPRGNSLNDVIRCKGSQAIIDQRSRDVGLPVCKKLT